MEYPHKGVIKLNWDMEYQLMLKKNNHLGRNIARKLSNSVEWLEELPN